MQMAYTILTMSSSAKKKYYDPDNKILAIGDIYGEGKCIEFAKGQYVVIDDFNRLVSAFSLISE